MKTSLSVWAGVCAFGLGLSACNSETSHTEQPQKDPPACEYGAAVEGEGLITRIETLSGESAGTSVVHLDWQATGTEVTKLVLPLPSACIDDEGYRPGLSVAVDRLDRIQGVQAAFGLLCTPVWVKLPDVFSDSCQVFREKGAGAFVEL